MKTPLEIVVLGSSGGYAGAGKACSSFLLTYGDKNFVLDLGAGALGNLLKYLSPEEIGGVVITHMHYDHYVDIFGLCTARKFWEKPLPPLSVILPEGGSDALGRVVSRESHDSFMQCLKVREAKPDEDIAFDIFRVKTGIAKHIPDALVIRVEVNGQSVCYSGDTEFTDSLVGLARDCDLFICEATFTSETSLRLSGHLFASEAGEIAELAGAKRLLLTHIWPTLNGEMALEDAGKKFSGEIILAVEGLRIIL
ncbi:MAG: MBL fold metallo-hydrolase [Actinomycetota bacterium]|nr:MBL fold metallo-hydrolase [Actinomycetota bacterium]